MLDFLQIYGVYAIENTLFWPKSASVSPHPEVARSQVNGRLFFTEFRNSFIVI